MVFVVFQWTLHAESLLLLPGMCRARELAVPVCILELCALESCVAGLDSVVRCGGNDRVRLLRDIAHVALCA